MSPFFTVIIPTCNRVKMLDEAIKSVLQQTEPDFELIVVDDHSNDGTAQYVTALKDSRIIYVCNDHQSGGGGARNAGIFRASGEWVAFLDDDDLWMPEKLAVFRQKIAQISQDIGLIYSSFHIIDTDNHTVEAVFDQKKTGWVTDEIMCTNFIGTFSCVAIRTPILTTVNGLDERFSSMQDMELYVRVTQVSKVDYIDQPLVYVRRGHPNRISLGMQNKLDSRLLFRSKFADMIQKNPKLHHHTDARIFVAALHTGNWAIAKQTFFWTLAGLGIDIKNMGWVIEEIIWAGYRHFRQTFRVLFGRKSFR